jgi:hypothetical protein
MAEYGEISSVESPGGFVFGVQGWMWGQPRPTSITFFLDGTVKVSDQYGRPIRGAFIDNKEIKFAPGPPGAYDPPGSRSDGRGGYVSGFATHAQVLTALELERVEWQKLSYAGWPQLPYSELKKLDPLPPTPIAELRKIRDSVLRKDALRIRREADEQRAEELGILDDEEDE